MGIYQPLRYQISNWRQLPACKSNNSRELHIHVADFLQNFTLSGFRIEIRHDTLGTLFACVIRASGNLVSTSPGSDVPFELTTSQILAELEKYGFLVAYNPRSLLKGDQLQYLMTLQNLHFDKIRVLKVRHVGSDVVAYTTHVIAFNIKENPNWIDNTYAASDTEFSKALTEGSAMNIDNISETQKYDWSWLDYVANISDILKDNAEVSSLP